MKKTATWKTITGKEVTVTAKLITEEVVDLDGDKVTIKCCKKRLDVHVEGVGSQGGAINTITSMIVNGVKIVATVGKLGLTQDQVEIIRNLEKEIENAPELIAKKALISKKKKENAKMWTARIANGYCTKCGTYCCGDCE